MIRGVVYVSVAFVLACSRGGSSNADGAAPPDVPADREAEAGDTIADGGDASDAGPPTAQGRVLVVQSGGASSAMVWTQAWFAWSNPCGVFPPTIYNCSCTDSESAGCTTRTCGGLWGHVAWHPFLGYDPGDGLQTSAAFPTTAGELLDAGALAIADGATVLSHGSPYDAHDLLPAPWQAGDSIRISAQGAIVPPFSVAVPFPPSVTFLQPDLTTGKVVFDSSTLDIKWTPAQGTGSVEATIAGLRQGDAVLSVVVTRCSAPVGQGEMAVPVPTTGAMGDSWRGLAVRVINRQTVQRPGLTVDAVVASFDSGPLDEPVPPGP